MNNPATVFTPEGATNEEKLETIINFLDNYFDNFTLLDNTLSDENKSEQMATTRDMLTNYKTYIKKLRSARVARQNIETTGTSDKKGMERVNQADVNRGATNDLTMGAGAKVAMAQKALDNAKLNNNSVEIAYATQALNQAIADKEAEEAREAAGAKYDASQKKPYSWMPWGGSGYKMQTIRSKRRNTKRRNSKKRRNTKRRI
jgi:hypothetical protein